MQTLHVVAAAVAAVAAVAVVAIELPLTIASFGGVIQVELACAVATGLGKCHAVAAGHQQRLDPAH